MLKLTVMCGVVTLCLLASLAKANPLDAQLAVGVICNEKTDTLSHNDEPYFIVADAQNRDNVIFTSPEYRTAEEGPWSDRTVRPILWNGSIGAGQTVELIIFMMEKDQGLDKKNAQAFAMALEQQVQSDDHSDAILAAIKAGATTIGEILNDNDDNLGAFQVSLTNNGGDLELTTTPVTDAATFREDSSDRTKLRLTGSGSSYYITATAGIMNPPPPSSTARLQYMGHVANVGDVPWVQQGHVLGTTGQSNALERITIAKASGSADFTLRYRGHVQNVGNTPWVDLGGAVGSAGNAQAIEGLQIELTGAASNRYDVYYSAHLNNDGWGFWVKNGQWCGRTGMGGSIEAVKIFLADK